MAERLTKAQENILKTKRIYKKDAEFTGRQLKSINKLKELGLIQNINIRSEWAYSCTGSRMEYSETRYLTKVITFDLI